MKKILDIFWRPLYNTQAVRDAAIAQPVERILGKDEVASSNLASSSKRNRPSCRMAYFFWNCAGFEDLNVTLRWGAAATSSKTDSLPNLFGNLKQGMLL